MRMNDCSSFALSFFSYLSPTVALTFTQSGISSHSRTIISAIGEQSVTWAKDCVVTFCPLTLIPAHQNMPSLQMNMSAFTGLQYGHAEHELIKGIRLIESTKSSSSCKKIATEQLLNSCSNLDSSLSSQEHSSGEELDKVKSQYAARMAVCELKEAENPPKLPRCSVLAPLGPGWPVDRAQLASCLRELQDSMVFWGSYTNSLQNVGYMCQVARAEIEKEELVEQRRASLETTLMVTRVLAEFQHSVATQNSELLTHAQKLRELHNLNVEELAIVRQDTSAILHQLRQEFSHQMENMADNAAAVVHAVTTKSSATNQELLQHAQNVHHSLENIWQMMVKGNAEVAAHQLDDSAQSHELALAAQETLEKIVMEQVGKLSDGLSGLSSELSLVGNQVESLRHGHASLVESIDESVAKSVVVANTLDKLNVPILEILAKAASMANFILSDQFLVFLGFISPIPLLILYALFLQIKVLIWLVRLGVLLASSYGKSLMHLGNCYLLISSH